VSSTDKKCKKYSLTYLDMLLLKNVENANFKYLKFNGKIGFPWNPLYECSRKFKLQIKSTTAGLIGQLLIELYE
jgi:hypothetical protein